MLASALLNDPAGGGRHAGLGRARARGRVEFSSVPIRRLIATGWCRAQSASDFATFINYAVENLVNYVGSFVVGGDEVGVPGQGLVFLPHSHSVPKPTIPWGWHGVGFRVVRPCNVPPTAKTAGSRLAASTSGTRPL
jgi:hypothetical protein